MPFVVVKWGSEASREFHVPLGVKQGGINSPDYFSLYLDPLMEILRSKGIGCHIGKLDLASIFFADDICLIVPPLSDFVLLLFVLDFNVWKSKIIVFSKSQHNLDHLQPIMLNGKTVEYV